MISLHKFIEFVLRIGNTLLMSKLTSMFQNIVSIENIQMAITVFWFEAQVFV